MTNPTGTKPFVRVSIYHQNDSVFNDLAEKIRDFLKSLEIEERDLRIWSVEAQSAGEHPHMNVDVQVEIYGNLNETEETLEQKMYRRIKLKNFRLSLVVEKRDGMVLRNF